jgi:sec-independent protein translocase protein TatA
MFGGRIGGGELIIILAVLLLLFGARKLPDLARSIGQSAKEFRKGIQEGTADEPEEADEEAEKSAQADESAPAEESSAEQSES